MQSYYQLPDFLTDIEKEHFLSLIDSPDFINHKSTNTGIASPLNFLPVEFRGIDRVLLMKMYPNAVQDWHTDGVGLRRHSVIIHPLTKDYACAQTNDGEINGTAILNTQAKHAVFNNNTTRMNLQIPIDESFENLIQNKDSKHWKIIERLYNDN